MELKSRKLTSTSSFNSSNRTFMELKYMSFIGDAANDAF